MVASLPCGFLVDRMGGRGRRMLMGGGWLGTTLAFALLGPLKDAATAAGAARLGFSPAHVVAATLALLGLAGAAVVTPTQTDLLAGLTSEAQRAWTCAAWNGLYSLGAAVGPLAMPPAVEAFGFGRTNGLAMGVTALMALLLGAAAWLSDDKLEAATTPGDTPEENSAPPPVSRRVSATTPGRRGLTRQLYRSGSRSLHWRDRDAFAPLTPRREKTAPPAVRLQGEQAPFSPLARRHGSMVNELL